MDAIHECQKELDAQKKININLVGSKEELAAECSKAIEQREQFRLALENIRDYATDDGESKGSSADGMRRIATQTLQKVR